MMIKSIDELKNELIDAIINEDATKYRRCLTSNVYRALSEEEKREIDYYVYKKLGEMSNEDTTGIAESSRD